MVAITITGVIGVIDFSATGCVTLGDATAVVVTVKGSLEGENGFGGGGSCLSFANSKGTPYKSGRRWY